MKAIIAAFGLLVLTAASTVHAHHDGEIFRKGDMRVSHVHTDVPSPSAHGIHVYLTMENTGRDADRLLDASVSFANGGVFQASVVDDAGTLTVQEVKAIAVAPGQFVFLEPGGARIAFDDVKRTIEAGDHLHMTLTFERAGSLEVEIEVEPAEATDTPPALDTESES